MHVKRIDIVSFGHVHGQTYCPQSTVSWARWGESTRHRRCPRKPNKRRHVYATPSLARNILPFKRTFPVVSLHRCCRLYEHRAMMGMLFKPDRALRNDGEQDASFNGEEDVFGVYEVVSLRTCVLPLQIRIILEMLQKLMRLCELMGSRATPPTSTGSVLRAPGTAMPRKTAPGTTMPRKNPRDTPLPRKKAKLPTPKTCVCKCRYSIYLFLGIFVLVLVGVRLSVRDTLRVPFWFRRCYACRASLSCLIKVHGCAGM